MKVQRLSTCSFKLFSPGKKIVLIDPWLTNDPLWPLAERTPEKLKEIMEPEQAAYAANATGCKYVIPCHDFPRNVAEAANPEAYAEFASHFPVLETYKKIDKFMEIVKNQYPQITPVYIPIGETATI